MNLFKASRPVPKITKQYRLLWRVGGLAGYQTVTAEGVETLLIHPDGSQSVSVIGGLERAPGDAVTAEEESGELALSTRDLDTARMTA